MKSTLLTFICFLYASFIVAQAPIINSTKTNNTIIKQYEKFELSLDLDAAYTNPYSYEEIEVKAIFTDPEGKAIAVDGFYMEDFDLNITIGALKLIEDSGKFKIRFAPTIIGDWSYKIIVRDTTDTPTELRGSFVCTNTDKEKNKGFIRPNMTNYLQYDNGDQYIAIGENIGWPGNNKVTSMRAWIDKLDENGGNFFRLWHAHWGLGIEWKDGWSNFEGLLKYKQTNCFIQDYLFDYCSDKDMHIMLALQHHGQVSSQVNPNWQDSPYNAINEGMCNNTWDFFTDSLAITHTKNRLRYIVARWGYSRSIMAWELFNEVDWTDNFSTHKSKVQDWHLEMAAYLKEIDPYQHIVTTSYAHENNDPFVWANPDIDITQTHFYINSSNLERAAVRGVRQYINEFEKPTLVGEFGLGGNANLANQDPDGIHLHNNLWGPLFGGGMGTGMTWWWDSYIHPRNLYYHFESIAVVANAIPFLKENMTPTSSYVIGAPGDLNLTPSLGWGAKGDEMITVNADGTTSPTSPRLGQYLYGAAWNTQFRSPPTFAVFFPEAGEFILKTNTATGQAAKISISVNDSLVLNEIAATNATYTVAIPAGNNVIKIDNNGTDWITIASYSFTGVGSQVDSYTLISESQKLASGWVLNHQYNHTFLNEQGEPESVVGAEAVIEGLLDGDYFVHWFDCLTGATIGSEAVSALDNQLVLPLPELFWDMTFLINQDAGQVVSVFDKKVEHLDFRVFPNPVQIGGQINLQGQTLEGAKSMVSLLDVTGREVYRFKQTDAFDGLTLTIPVDLGSGFYWVKVQNGIRVGVKPMVLKN